MAFLGDLRTLSRGRDFRRLLATRLTSQIGDGVFQVGLAGYVFFSPERQATPTKAAAAFAVVLLPYSLVGPFAGVFIDRWSRRQILLYSALIRATLVAFTAALIATGSDGPPFYLGALGVLSVNRFFLSALSAALPHVVVRHHLVMANSLTTTSGTVATFLGAGFGYLPRLIFGGGRTGTSLVLLSTALWYAAAGLLATRMRRDRLGPDHDARLPETREALRRVVRGIAAGARHVWQDRAVTLALGVMALHRFLYGVMTITTVLLCRNYFTHDVNAGVDGLAAVVVASGAGYFVAALITPTVTRHVAKQTWITALLAAAGLVLLVAATPFRQGPFVAAGFALGVVSQGVKICVDTTVQECIDDAYRGRVFSFYDMLFNVSFVSAAAFAALTVPADGKSYPILGLLVAGYILAAVVFAIFGRSPGETGDAAAVAAAPPAASER